MEIFYVNIEKSNIFIDIIKKRLYTELEVKENMGNICRFIPPNKNIGGINIIRFVYETKKLIMKIQKYLLFIKPPSLFREKALCMFTVMNGRLKTEIYFLFFRPYRFQSKPKKISSISTSATWAYVPI